MIKIQFYRKIFSCRFNCLSLDCLCGFPHNILNLFSLYRAALLRHPLYQFRGFISGDFLVKHHTISFVDRKSYFERNLLTRCPFGRKHMFCPYFYNNFICPCHSADHYRMLATNLGLQWHEYRRFHLSLATIGLFLGFPNN